MRCSDFQRALAFYADVLGCCVYSETGAMLLTSDGFAITLIEDDVGGSPDLLRAVRRRGPVAEFVVEDFDERLREFSIAGCRFAASVSKATEPLHYVQVVDPFEYLWMLRRYDERLHAEMKPRGSASR